MNTDEHPKPPTQADCLVPSLLAFGARWKPDTHSSSSFSDSLLPLGWVLYVAWLSGPFTRSLYPGTHWAPPHVRRPSPAELSLCPECIVAPFPSGSYTYYPSAWNALFTFFLFLFLLFFFDRLSDCLLMSYQEHQAKLTVFPSLGLVIVLGQWLVPVLFRYSFISSCTHLVLNIISLSHAFDICS